MERQDPADQSKAGPMQMREQQDRPRAYASNVDPNLYKDASQKLQLLKNKENYNGKNMDLFAAVDRPGEVQPSLMA